VYFPFLLIAIGIAADNLMIANISGTGTSITKNHRWVLILLLLFTIQNQVVMYGFWLSGLFHPVSSDLEFWMAVGILFSICINMAQELKLKSKKNRNVYFDTKMILGYALVSSIYAFLLGSVAGWLLVGRQELLRGFLPFIALFMLLGLLIGKYGYSKVLKPLNILSVCLILVGTGILVLHKIN
jgi:putative Mn2+ efflux pump MntP